MSEHKSGRQPLIYNLRHQDFPNPPRPERLTTHVLGRLSTWLGVHAASVAADPSAEHLHNLSWAEWHIGGRDRIRRSGALWRQARGQPEHTPTLENDVAREWIGHLLEIDEADLAWRTLRRIVPTMRKESLERQGYTAHLAAQIATASGNQALHATFREDAYTIWQQAIALGEDVDSQLFAETKPATPNPPEQSLDTKNLMSPGARAAAQHAAQTIWPPEAGEGAKGGVI